MQERVNPQCHMNPPSQGSLDGSPKPERLTNINRNWTNKGIQVGLDKQIDNQGGIGTRKLQQADFEYMEWGIDRAVWLLLLSIKM